MVLIGHVESAANATMYTKRLHTDMIVCTDVVEDGSEIDIREEASSLQEYPPVAILVTAAPYEMHQCESASGAIADSVFYRKEKSRSRRFSGYSKTRARIGDRARPEPLQRAAFI